MICAFFLLASLYRQLLLHPWVHSTHVLALVTCANARVGSSVGANEKCYLPSLHVHPPFVLRLGWTLVAGQFE